ncbi:MAG: glycosyltransferase [Candidatus Sulfotelmatobacter sp.]
MAMGPQVSVIIPARNEEASLGACLDSLTDQSGFSFEVIVVNDQSTDRTREIAKSAPGVRVIDADPLRPGWTGKNNAIAAGLGLARCEWILFTDADTIHRPGSLQRAWEEARENQVDMLSYSPEQLAVTFWERATLPVIFAELARQYPPSKVSDPNSPEAAANGQYILVRREAYEAVGGHASVASEILEDVALARAFKAGGFKIRFRYAPDAVRTRMYRNFRQLREGWTKNLAVLFPNPGWLAAESIFLWTLLWVAFFVPHKFLLACVIFVVAVACVFVRVKASNFSAGRTLLGVLFGIPMFAYLLLRSKRAHAKGSVAWKGRSYDQKDSSRKASRPAPVPAGRIS